MIKFKKIPIYIIAITFTIISLQKPGKTQALEDCSEAKLRAMEVVVVNCDGTANYCSLSSEGVRTDITFGEGVWASGSEKFVSGLTGPYTIEQWAISVLKNIARKSGVPETDMVTQAKVESMVAWAKAEGGGVDGHNGTWNPLNTKSDYSDIAGSNQGDSSTDSNSQGYTSFDDGVEAITRAIFNKYQKRISSALLNPGMDQLSFIEAVAGDFYSPDGKTVINRLEDIYPGDSIYAALSVTGFDYGGGIGDREEYIRIKQGTLKSVQENYEAYAGKILDGSPAGTPAPLVFSSSGTGTVSQGVGCDQDSNSEQVSADGFIIYKQNDPKWADEPYGVGGRTIASSGCGPSAMAMIITSLTGTEVTPSETAAYGNRPDVRTYTSDGGSDGVALAEKIAPQWGLTARYIGASETEINNTLKSGGLVIVSGRGGLPFSTGGHFVVIRALTDTGKWLVGDSSHGSVEPDTSTVEYEPSEMIADFTAGGYSSYAITK